ncbi:response regulator [Paenibacillus sp. SYP-B3998]|uniref:Response regulator n=1 Tax=Paenibacillus sp. SYP-B3998 TaxID=2678564 RepID=A0A6G4A0N0_9BACL|nr:response regulator [Paenibacillus sp. SYP-B3998]NEW07379.1 response regulator [Paenibacillus sp. SYP-B3998]
MKVMKVMIVEDEVLVRLGLKKAVPWSTLGMELVCEASDGAEAYEMFVRHLPDIVLVDIELPKMDGLRFIQFAKKHREDAKFIILTCQQDIKYARSAIQLQVSDFLLKSTLDIKELCDILQNISVEMLLKRHREDDSGSPELDRVQRKKRFLQSWLDGILPKPDAERSDAQLQEFASLLQAASYQAWVIQLNQEDESKMDESHAFKEIEQQATQRFGSRCLGIVPDTEKIRLHLVFAGASSTAEILSWQESMQMKLGRQMTIAASSIFVNPYEWRSNDLQAAELLQLQFYKPNGNLFNDSSLIRDTLTEPVQRIKKDLYDRIGALQFAEISELVGVLCETLLQPPFLHPHMIKNMFTEMLFRIWSACEEIADASILTNHQFVDRIYAAVQLEDIVELLLDEVRNAEKAVAACYAQDDKSKLILLIKQYIKSNLHREVSLQEIADTFHMNNSYLSRMFKEVTDSSFTEYVLYEKTEAAMALMKSGMPLTEISDKLGYQNLSSFTRMFKKVRGISPSRYQD